VVSLLARSGGGRRRMRAGRKGEGLVVPRGGVERGGRCLAGEIVGEAGSGWSWPESRPATEVE
jgi:hypothetical protein